MLRRFRPFAKTAAYVGLVVIIGIWCGALFLARAEHQRAYEEGLRQGTNLARIFKEYIARVIGGGDNVLLILRDAYEHDPNAFDIELPFRHSARRDAEVVNYSIVDASGEIKVSSFVPIKKPTNVRDRDYFQFHANSINDELFISAPMTGRLSGRTSVQLTRRLPASDGSFGGLMLATLDIVRLENFYASIDLGAGGVISLVGTDGIIRARSGKEPGAKDFVGRSILNTQL